MTRTAVVYLSRWGNHPRWSRAFLDSLIRCAAGREYDLIFALKGFPEGANDEALTALRAKIPARVSELRLSDEGYDLNVYFRAAAEVANDRMLFFNSYSRILAADWLASYEGALERVPKCGIVGATGSFETIPGMAFPNVNIRTNAFMIPRELFLAIDRGPLALKSDCNRLEAGPTSLTRQIVQRGLEPVLVDRTGKVWRIPDWPVSGVFRSRRQEGLLVADNRTQHYATAGASKRLKLARLAWGEAAKATHIPLLERLQSEIAWRWP
jgi:hypothetical protein